MSVRVDITHEARLLGLSLVSIVSIILVVTTVPAGADEPTASCAEERPRREALRRALRAVGREHPELDAVLRPCASPADVCADPAPDRRRCTVRFRTEPWGHEITLRPAAANDAPDELVVRVASASDETHRVLVSGSRWGVLRRPPVAIVGVTGHARHTHGGPPARIAHATFRVHNDAGRPLPIAIREARWQHDGHERELQAPSLSVSSIPAGESELEVRFPVQEAYQTWNDHFALTARFRIGDAEISARAAYLVARVEPLRQRR